MRICTSNIGKYCNKIKHKKNMKKHKKDFLNKIRKKLV